MHSSRRIAPYTDPEYRQRWKRSGHMAPLSELSPRYIQRQSGVQNSGTLTHHEWLELIFVFSGSPEFVWMDKGRKRSCVMPAASAVLVPANVAHYEWSEKPFDRLYVGLEGAQAKAINVNTIHPIPAPGLEPYCTDLWRRSRSVAKFNGPELDALTLFLFQSLLRYDKEAKDAKDASLHSIQYSIDKAIHYFHEHYSRSVSMADVAEHLGLSEGYFFRSFKAETGQTPTAYLNAIRIQEATHMLTHSTLSVQRIAKLTGFADPLYFSRVFKKMTGQSPREIRA